MQPQRVQRSTLISAVIAAVALAVVLVITGGSDKTSYTVSVPPVASVSSPAASAGSSTEAAASTAAASTTPAYPVVHFNFLSDGETSGSGWPFTAQIASITLNPSGIPVSYPVSRAYTYLIVKVNLELVGSAEGRSLQAPGPIIACTGTGSSSWQQQRVPEGYDQGENGVDPNGSSIAIGDGQPHLWDTEWKVPVGTKTTEVACTLESQGKIQSLT